MTAVVLNRQWIRTYLVMPALALSPRPIWNNLAWKLGYACLCSLLLFPSKLIPTTFRISASWDVVWIVKCCRFSLKSRVLVFSLHLLTLPLLLTHAPFSLLHPFTPPPSLPPPPPPPPFSCRDTRGKISEQFLQSFHHLLHVMCTVVKVDCPVTDLILPLTVSGRLHMHILS